MAAKCQRNSSFTFFKDFVGPASSSVKCQLLILMFVGFGCQPGFRVYASRQSLEQSCTQIGKLPLNFFSLALASQPFKDTKWSWWISELFLDHSITAAWGTPDTRRSHFVPRRDKGDPPKVRPLVLAGHVKNNILVSSLYLSLNYNIITDLVSDKRNCCVLEYIIIILDHYYHHNHF